MCVWVCVWFWYVCVKMLTAEWCLCVYVQIGKALMEALKKLVSEDKVPPALAVRVMKAFDRVRVYVTTQRKSVCVW